MRAVRALGLATLCLLTGATSLPAEAPLQVSFRRIDATNSTLRGLRFEVSVKNTGQEPLIIHSITLRCPPELGKRKCQDGVVTAQVGTDPAGTELNVGAPEARVELTIPERSGLSVVTEYPLLFFTKGRLQLSGTVDYSVVGTRQTLPYSGEFEFDPPLISLLIAGVCGAIAGTLFSQLAGVAEEYRRVGSVQAPRRYVIGGLLDVLATSVLAVIAIIMLLKTTTLNNVISVRLIDFYGGFVVGLLLQSRRGELFTALAKLLGSVRPQKRKAT